MAVLVEAISVVIRRSAIEALYPGGWDSFAANAPNSTLCADRRLARVGFMQPTDVEAFIRELERTGFVYREGGAAKDLAVLDQQRGSAVPCPWIEFGHIELAPGQRVAVCREVGDTENIMASPDSWKYEGSLSETFGFVPTSEEDKSLRFLRHEAGLDVYLNEVTGDEVFVGRTGER